jgi:hypothetical protein
LKRIQPPKPNPTGGGRAAVTELEENKDIRVVLVDKGTAAVILDSRDY